MVKKSFEKSFVRQQGQSDCGVACLSSILKYHGGDSSLEKLRELSGTSRTGTTLLGLYQAAEKLGFDAEGMQAETIDNLAELKEPSILHVVINNTYRHYFVFYGFDNNGDAIIGDPASGITKYKKDALNLVWQDKTLLKLVPNNSFISVETKSKDRKNWVIDLFKEDSAILITALVIGIVTSILGLSTALFSQKLVDNILPSKDNGRIILSLILLGMLLLARSGLLYVRGIFIVQQGKGLNSRIIEKFYGSLLHLPKAFFDSKKIGELIARMNDTRRIQTTISMIFGSILIDFLFVLASIGLIFAYSYLIGYIILVCIPVYLLLTYLFNGKIINSQQGAMRSYALTESHYIDTMQGIETIKVTGKESFFEEANKKTYDFFQTKIFDLGKLTMSFSFVTDAVSVVFIVITFGISATMVLNESLRLGEMVGLLSMVGGMFPSLNRLAVANFQVQEAVVAFDRMFEFASIPPEIIDNGTTVQSINRVSFKNVSFRFTGRPQLLKGITLEMNQGEMVAIMGESGSGKSTLAQLLQKFYSPEQGEIICDGKSLDKISTQEWRTQLGVVPQDIKIFNGSLLYNITLSNSQEDFEEGIKLCQQYQLESYFQSFPAGYASLLGEEGINISGGQRQLVAMARALYRRPKFLILDEATSAMDRNMESFIITLLQSLKSEMTIVFITHRVTTAQKADRVYVLESGCIVSGGSPSELMTTNNFFSQSAKEFRLT